MSASIKVNQINQSSNYYSILGLTPWANERQIRQAYRDLSKLYHPDTTQLPQDVAVEKFRQINQAYATLSNPERRGFYDRRIQFSRAYQFEPQRSNSKKTSDQPLNHDSGLPTQRPLSAGELFILLILGVTLAACIGLAIAVSIVRGDQLFPT